MENFEQSSSIIFNVEDQKSHRRSRKREKTKQKVQQNDHVPHCMNCAKLIYQSGIGEVYYAEPYREKHGVEFLEKCGVKVSQWQKTTT